MSDTMLHSISEMKQVPIYGSGLELIRSKLENSRKANYWPKYLGEARFVALSKVETQYPQAE